MAVLPLNVFQYFLKSSNQLVNILVHRKMNQTGEVAGAGAAVENSTSFLFPALGIEDWNNQ